MSTDQPTDPAGIEPADDNPPNVPICRDSVRSAFADGPWEIVSATGYSSSSAPEAAKPLPKPTVKQITVRHTRLT